MILKKTDDSSAPTSAEIAFQNPAIASCLSLLGILLLLVGISSGVLAVLNHENDFGLQLTAVGSGLALIAWAELISQTARSAHESKLCRQLLQEMHRTKSG